MNKIYKIIATYALTLFLFSCAFDMDSKGGIKGNGTVLIENRKVSDSFDAVVASENLNVYVTQADDFSIRVEADENIINHIGTDIKDGKLHIHTTENIGRAIKKIHVSLPNISALISTTGSSLQTLGSIQEDSMLLRASAGSIMKAKLIVDQVVFSIKEGAKLTILGAADDVTINVSAGGNIDAEEFQATNCTANASSGGMVKIKVVKSLVADANTGGNILYSGEPDVDDRKSVSGSVQKY